MPSNSTAPVASPDPLFDDLLPSLRELAVRMAQAQAQAEAARQTAITAMSAIEERLAGVDPAKAGAIRQLLGLRSGGLSRVSDAEFTQMWKQHGPDVADMIGCSRQRAYARARELGLESPIRRRRKKTDVEAEPTQAAS